MSGNSSDSESSCGWTIINHEGSDIETLHSETEPCPDLAVQHSTFGEDVQPDPTDELSDVCSNEVTILNVENLQSTSEDYQGATELLSSFSSCPKPDSSPMHTEHHDEGCAVGEDNHCEAVSDDSDIVTLETPKVDEVGPLEEEIPEDVSGNTALNMSFSSSSQYTFSQPEAVFPSQPSEEDSSNDEASDDSGPFLRRRRSKKSVTSGSESVDSRIPAEQSVAPAPRTLGWMSSGLNKCIILTLVIAISMGFGHFYGTIQILERQRYVEKIHESEINEMKDDLFHCQRDQEATSEHKEVVEQLTEDLEERQDLVLSLEGLMDKITKENHILKQKQSDLKLAAEDLATSLKTTEVQNKNLAFENQHLRESLEKEEQALSSLKEELRKLREQIRNLDEKGRHEIMLTENQKLREHLKEERQKVRNFRTEKETLLNEAQLLRKELDNERRITDALRVELEEISKRRSSAASFKGDHEIEHLKVRLSELEEKLNFEQQRSDLWERLYIETREQNEKLGAGNSHQETDQSKEGKSKGKTKKKTKDTFFSSVKDTFDAMKNSTKEFVRHHKEKIKQAKEAVKENLKKFSDSVKNTFRHFKDTTRGMFDKNRNRKHAERRREETKGARTVRREYKPNSEKMYPNKAAAGHRDYPDDQSSEQFEGTSAWKSNSEEKVNDYPNKKGCSGVYDCAHQESISLFNKVLDPVRVEEFNDLMQVYLQEQVDNFQHWDELEQFINSFFPDGVFIHDQMLFTDFVKNVEDYLEDMKEYQTNTGGVFEDLDEFVYRHYFGNAYSTPHGPRKPERTPYKHENKNHRKEEEKHQAQYKREGKWNKHGRANGRQMANVEIELGQLPFDPKY